MRKSSALKNGKVVPKRAPKTKPTQEETTSSRRKQPPSITFEQIWTAATKVPPYNPYKAINLQNKISEFTPFPDNNKNEQLISLLGKCLESSPILDSPALMQNLNNLLNVELTEAEVQQLKTLLMELISLDEQYRDLVPITVLRPAELQYVSTLVYRDTDEKILVLGNRSMVFELISLLLTVGYSDSVKFLSTLTSETEFLFNLPTLKVAREKSILDLKILKWKPKIEAGTSRCHRCKSQQLWVFEKQTRSSDEPMTLFYQCMNCGRRGTL